MLIVQEVTTGPTTAQKHLLAATSLSGLGESTAFLVMVAAARMVFLEAQYTGMMKTITMPTDINLQSPMETTVVIPEFNTAVGVMQVTCIYIIC